MLHKLTQKMLIRYSDCFCEIIILGHDSAKQQTIQHVINNLQISTLEYRNESDPDVMSFVHDRNIEVIQVLLVTYMITGFYPMNHKKV